MKVISKEMEIITYFEKDGKISLIKFRIEEEGKCQVINIGNIINVDLEKLCGNRMFICSAIIEEIKKIFEFEYDIGKLNWIWYKV